MSKKKMAVNKKGEAAWEQERTEKARPLPINGARCDDRILITK